jgi:hypothetical protein
MALSEGLERFFTASEIIYIKAIIPAIYGAYPRD